MSDKIDSIKLPNSGGTEITYDIDLPKDATPSIDSLTTTNNITVGGEVLMDERSYTNLYGNANSWAGATWYFLTVHPTAWTSEWTIRYRLEIQGANSNYQGTYQCIVSGSHGIYTTYHFLNSFYSTSYRPIYYHVNHSTTQAGYNAGYGHKIGISLYNAQNPTSSSYSRDVRVVLLECQNCTAELNDTLEIPPNSTMTGYTKLNSTYYTTTNTNSAGNYNLLNGYDQGLSETGDANTVITYGTLEYYFRPYNGANPLYRYKFVALDKDNRVVPLTTTNVANGTAVTNITPTNVAFRPDKIWWYSTTTTIAASGLLGAQTLWRSGYNANSSTNGGMAICNFNETVPAYRLIYLCGIYNKTTGLFILRDGGTASSKNYYKLVPTNTANITLSSYFTRDYDYILLGGTYSSNNYIQLFDNNPMFHFDGSHLLPWDSWNASQSSGGVSSVLVSGVETVSSGVASIATQGAYNPSTNKLATMNDIPSSSNFVTLTGTQNIGGNKTFSNELIVRNNLWIKGGHQLNIEDTDSQGENLSVNFFTDGLDENEITFEASTVGTIGIMDGMITAGGYILSNKTPAEYESRLHKWWYYQGSLSRSLTTTSDQTINAMSLSSITLVNSTSSYLEYAGTVSGGTVTKVNIAKGDFIFSSYGEIGVVSGVPKTQQTASAQSIKYKTRWISAYPWTCLEEGTLITMSDRTTKPIEEVKQGDLILGWDFENNKSIEAMALTNVEAQISEEKVCLVFSNGETLFTSKHHDIYSVTKGMYIDVDKVEEGEKCLDVNGEEVEIYTIHRNLFDRNKSKFYQLISSNNTYFANNIMNAYHPNVKYNWLMRTGQEIPKEVLNILIQDTEEATAYIDLFKNKEFIKQSVAITKEIKTRENTISKEKQFLLDTDYVALKYAEGKNIDEQIIVKRQSARDIINQCQDEIENIYRPQYNKLLTKNSPLGTDILLNDIERQSKYFKIANKRDNEALNIFKKYYHN